MKVIMFGDVVGVRASETLANSVRKIRKKYNADFVTLNAENSASNGVNSRLCSMFFESGIDVLTFGNHTFTRLKEFTECAGQFENLVRPANMPDECPGNKSLLVPRSGGRSGHFSTEGRKVPCNGRYIGVVNLIGRVFMEPQNSPYEAADREIEGLREHTNIILVDFHAEATSEKIAMGYYLDGKVSAVVGTHTHVMTADEEILENGTAYITDVGMVGAKGSCLGVSRETAMKRLIERIPVRNQPAEGDIIACGVVIDINEETGKAINIERIKIEL